ncbi:hypothetical protein E2C01_017492 [Portunus trituberculatus]|uniref:Uncharacterized protein n=1 Tax=Portunus trituberculatus TaxID=210409 RepID=A0A5B7DS04_PORTR|nr:hypothetical protein [Portunus trituberculatus]
MKTGRRTLNRQKLSRTRANYCDSRETRRENSPSSFRLGPAKSEQQTDCGRSGALGRGKGEPLLLQMTLAMF